MAIPWIGTVRRVPLRAVIGAALGLTSYIVASIYKQEYDGTAATLKAYAAEIDTTPSTLLSTRLAKAIIFNFEDQIATTRSLLLMIQRTLPDDKKKPFSESDFFVINEWNNELRWQLSSTTNAALDRILGAAPAAARDIRVDVRDYASKSWLSSLTDLRDCIAKQDGTRNKVFEKLYIAELEEFEKAQVAPRPDSMSLGAFQLFMRDRYVFVRSAQFKLRFDPILSGNLGSYAEMRSTQAHWERIDVKCFDSYRTEHDQLLTLVLGDVSSDIRLKLLPVVETRKRWLGNVEVGLYVLGLLIALAKEVPRPSPPAKPQPRPARSAFRRAALRRGLA